LKFVYKFFFCEYFFSQSFPFYRIGNRNITPGIAISVTRLGDILPFRLLFTYQFSPKKAVSTQGLFKGFKSNLMWMFWTFKLIFDVDILDFWATFSKHSAKLYSIFWSHWARSRPLFCS
jgi:hypothetical protein